MTTFSPTLAERIHGCGTGRAIVLASASALALYVKKIYVMGKALSGELSCPCYRSCFFFFFFFFVKSSVCPSDLSRLWDRLD